MEENKLGMKWHGFLCFWLPFSGITGILGSIFSLAGTIFTADSHLERYAPGYVAFEYFRYTVLLIFGVLLIIAWVGLHKFRKGAPRFYILLSGVYALIMTVLMVFTMIFIGTPVQTACLFTLPALVVSGMYLWLNHIYFRKRAHLYINE